MRISRFESTLACQKDRSAKLGSSGKTAKRIQVKPNLAARHAIFARSPDLTERVLIKARLNRVNTQPEAC